jgi:hypothetical protein
MALHLFASPVRLGGIGGDRFTQRGDGDGAGRKQVWLWAGGTPESESNLEVDVLRNIGIDICPGIRVESRERSGCIRLLRYSTRRGGGCSAKRDRGPGRWARRLLQHQAHGCRDREFLRLPSSILHETRRVPVGDPQGRKQMKSQIDTEIRFLLWRRAKNRIWWSPSGLGPGGRGSRKAQGTGIAERRSHRTMTHVLRPLGISDSPFETPLELRHNLRAPADLAPQPVPGCSANQSAKAGAPAFRGVGAPASRGPANPSQAARRTSR